ncbi:uncharacterized protein LOC113853024 [Abrus precatorius]|uniref:Uncharacterized protein LOC113853024 n=1 Tax=Abrus precatorius TaxID=3816 RepID=A0A8B8K666_ABRPR|nr:uncharacterized protein LOC113853024 [Abrus precatorius]
MAEEFSESEVVFSDHHHVPRKAEGFHEVLVVPPQKKSSRGQAVASSLPVNIPERMLRRWGSGEEEVAEEEGMVPPHEIVGRRVAGKMAFSVFTGNGRTLKGRDLSKVRNSVLRLTGFLEA